jgi:vacuolar-type H+-ATPase subunit E/Vma4
MSHEALIAALREKGKKKAGELWHEAEGEAERARAEALETFEKLRAQKAHEASLANRLLVDNIIREAEGESRRRLAAAKGRLAQRLYAVAMQILPRFREQDYSDTFSAIAAELPEGPWEEVRVNPQDSLLARKIFPAAQVVPDPSIAGGMDAVRGNSGFRVINTLGKRLERAWADILPECFKTIESEVLGHGTSAEGLASRLSC